MFKIIFFFILFLIACSDSINNTSTTTNVSTVESDTKGDLAVYAMDAVSGELIREANISISVAEDSFRYPTCRHPR